MNKRAVTIQPFIFIMALFMMAFVIIFAVRSFTDLKHTSDFAEVSLFVKKIQDETEIFYHFDVGSTKKISLLFPPGADLLCFTNPGTTPNMNIADSFFADVLEVNTNKNLFLLPLDAYRLTQFTVPYLMIDSEENPLCFTSSSGYFTAYLETVFVDDIVAVQIGRTP